MKSAEEVKEILEDEQSEKRIEMLKALNKCEFSYDELSCMLIGIIDDRYPEVPLEGFLIYCEYLRNAMKYTDLEVDQLN